MRKALECALSRQKAVDENVFTQRFGSSEGQLPVIADRYRLIWTEMCPWSQRLVILIKLLGLNKSISLGRLSSLKTKNGWAFNLDEGFKDPILEIHYLSEAYRKGDANYEGKFGVPALIDTTTGAVVNSDVEQLTRIFEVDFRSLHSDDAPDLYSKYLRLGIDGLNQTILRDVNSAVFELGLDGDAKDYQATCNRLFHRLDWLEKRLESRRYLLGSELTESDVRLWVTLVRFDSVYHPIFKADRNKLTDFPNLWSYAKRIYEIPPFRETTNFGAFMRGYDHKSDLEILLAYDGADVKKQWVE